MRGTFAGDTTILPRQTTFRASVRLSVTQQREPVKEKQRSLLDSREGEGAPQVGDEPCSLCYSSLAMVQGVPHLHPGVSQPLEEAMDLLASLPLCPKAPTRTSWGSQ